MGILEEHGQELSLPEEVSSLLDLFPHDLQHRLWLQTCFDALSGLGQEEELTLENEGQQHRVESFIERLRDHQDTVHYLISRWKPGYCAHSREIRR